VPTSVERLAFGVDQVRSLTGLTRRQLQYWDETGFFSPEFAGGDRVYSFRDLVGLRTIAKLRETVPLQDLRKVGEWLKREHETPWASLRFFRSGRTVHFRDPKTGDVIAANPEDQRVCIELEEIANEVRELIAARRRRSLSKEGKVERKHRVVRSRPVLAGTRIPVDAIWNFHEAGYSTEQILEEYPTLTANDVVAAIEYKSAKKTG
jgi:uncharacterized protein (DUF433 family)